MALRDLPVLSSPPPASISAPSIPQNFTHPGLSAQQVLAIVKAFKKQSAVIGFIVFVLMSFLAISKPKTYVATATLLVKFEINDPLAGKEFPLALLGSYIATQLELMSSPVVLLPVVDKLKLNENKKFAAVKGDANVQREAAEKTLERNLVIEQGRYGSQLIYIRYRGSSAQQAADIANAIGEVYTNREFQPPSGQESERSQQYAVQLAELKEKVESSENELADFQKRTGLIAGQGQNDVEMDNLVTLEARLLEAQIARRTAEVKNNSRQSKGRDVLSSAPVQELKTQLDTQVAQMAELRTSYGPKHPKILELQSQIDSTRQALSAAANVDSGNASAELENAREFESKLAGAAAKQRATVIAETELKTERAKLLSNLESAQTTYRRALDSYEQIARESASSYSNVNFVSHATPPTKAEGSRTRKGILLGMIAGGFVGLAGPLGWGLINRRVRCRDDIERDYGIPVIAEFGAIPARARGLA